MYESTIDGKGEPLRVEQHVKDGMATDPCDDESLVANIRLLKAKGIKAPDQELARISRLFDNQSLALTLLGNYLREVHEGDPARLDKIPIWLDQQQEGRHVRRVLAAYIKWLRGTPEWSLLSLVSVCGQPLSLEACQELATKVLSPPRRGKWLKRANLPEPFVPLKNLPSQKYLDAQKRLSELDLLMDTGEQGLLDVEPVVREYLDQQMQIRSPDAWHALRDVAKQSVNIAHDKSRDMQLIKGLQNQLDKALSVKNWQAASSLASRLCKHQQERGDLAVSIQYARQSAAYAELAHDQKTLQQSVELLRSLLQVSGDAREADVLQRQSLSSKGKISAAMVS